MFQNVLFPLDISAGMERLVRAAEEIVIAGVQHITLLHVVDRENALADPAAIEYGRKALDQWKLRLERCRPTGCLRSQHFLKNPPNFRGTVRSAPPRSP